MDAVPWIALGVLILGLALRLNQAITERGVNARLHDYETKVRNGTVIRK